MAIQTTALPVRLTLEDKSVITYPFLQGNTDVNWEIELFKDLSDKPTQQDVVEGTDTVKVYISKMKSTTDSEYILEVDQSNINIADNKVKVTANLHLTNDYGPHEIAVVLNNQSTFSGKYMVQHNQFYNPTVLTPVEASKKADIDLKNVPDMDFKAKAIASGVGGSGNGAVSSVNGMSGSVVLDTMNIHKTSDTSSPTLNDMFMGKANTDMRNVNSDKIGLAMTGSTSMADKDGKIPKWNNSTQKFDMVEPPSNVGAVSSVNDQTGKVLLTGNDIHETTSPTSRTLNSLISGKIDGSYLNGELINYARKNLSNTLAEDHIKAFTELVSLTGNDGRYLKYDETNKRLVFVDATTQLDPADEKLVRSEIDTKVKAALSAVGTQLNNKLDLDMGQVNMAGLTEKINKGGGSVYC